MKRLLDSQVRALRPKKHKYRKSDGDSLYLAVHPTGRKTFELRVIDDAGKSTYEKIADYPALSLRNARRQAAERRGQIEQAKRRAEGFADLDPAERPPLTFGDLLRHYQDNHILQTYRRPEQVQGYVNNTAPEIKQLNTYDLDARQTREFRMRVAAYLKQFAKTAGPVSANRAMSIFKQATRYGVVHGYLNVDPLAEITPRYVGGTERPRERTLTDDEIRSLWNTRSAHTPLLRFLLAAGQRIGETQQMRAEHLQDDRWVIPAAVTKNKRAHWVPLTDALLALIAEQGDAERVFGAQSLTGTQSWLRRWCDRNDIAPRFTPHDLRRTYKTRLAGLRIAREVRDRMVNHASRGLEAVYNQYDWEAERFEAQELWDKELARILGDE
ncbi:MAG: integrase family protein [Pseudomonadota bacterium]